MIFSLSPDSHLLSVFSGLRRSQAQVLFLYSPSALIFFLNLTPESLHKLLFVGAGFAEGLDDGFADGLRLGLFVFEGCMEGRLDGLELGSSKDGALLGIEEGSELGKLDGTKLG